MLSFEWNALRIGDAVLVHDPSRPDLALRDGTVMIVDSRRGTNDIGIVVTEPDGTTRMLRPNRLGVHRNPRESGVRCWQCDADVTASAG